MKTIYDRLNPDILVSINKDKETYPFTIGELVSKLKHSNYWSELTINEVQAIINHSHESFLTLSHQDTIWGDKFLIDEEN